MSPSIIPIVNYFHEFSYIIRNHFFSKTENTAGEIWKDFNLFLIKLLKEKLAGREQKTYVFTTQEKYNLGMHLFSTEIICFGLIPDVLR